MRTFLQYYIASLYAGSNVKSSWGFWLCRDNKDFIANHNCGFRLDWQMLMAHMAHGGPMKDYGDLLNNLIKENRFVNIFLEAKDIHRTFPKYWTKYNYCFVGYHMIYSFLPELFVLLNYYVILEIILVAVTYTTRPFLALTSVWLPQ